MLEGVGFLCKFERVGSYNTTRTGSTLHYSQKRSSSSCSCSCSALLSINYFIATSPFFFLLFLLACFFLSFFVSKKGLLNFLFNNNSNALFQQAIFIR